MNDDHLPPHPPRGPVHCPDCGDEACREKHPAEPEVGVEAFDGWYCERCGWKENYLEEGAAI